MSIELPVTTRHSHDMTEKLFKATLNLKKTTTKTLKIFVTLFSGTVRPTKSKLGTHMSWVYRVYRNQDAAAYLSLYYFIFFLSNSQTLKFFITLFSVRCTKLKLDTNMKNRSVYHVYWNQAAHNYHPIISSFFCLSNFQLLICLSSQIAL